MSTESTAVNQSARHLVMGLYEELDTKVYDTYEEAYAAGIEGVVDNLKGGEE